MSDKQESPNNNEPNHPAENGTPAQELAAKAESFAAEATQRLKEVGSFLKLHKQTSLIVAICCAGIILAICAALAANDSKPAASSTLPSQQLIETASQTVGSTIETKAESAKAGFIAQSLTPEALNAVDASASEPSTFSLVKGQSAETLSRDQLDSLTAAKAAIEGNGYTVGFTLINLNTGKGIAYNLDSRVYGASSFKGPYAAYLCQHLGDNDTSYPAGADSAGSGISSSINSLMVPMVVNSDNNAFSSLRNSYDSAGFAEWLTACGVDSSIMHDTHFPRYSARESALLWLRTYQYLKTDTPTAQRLASLYAQTNVSFIRTGVGGKEGVETVRNKAGWCASGARFTGLCDAGLIECADGTIYLMSTMTNSPDGGTYTLRLANLASALFDCRSALD